MSGVTDMSGVNASSGRMIGFAGWASFNGNISYWDTSSVTKMDWMFLEAKSFNSSIDNWDLSRVESTVGMFSGASAFNRDISNWSTAKVRLMNYMFHGTSAFNSEISHWDTSNVENMVAMFRGSGYNKPLQDWNTSKVSNMHFMFYEAVNFEQDISSWVGSAASNSQNNMFSGATSFQSAFKCTETVGGPASSCVRKPCSITCTGNWKFKCDCVSTGFCNLNDTVLSTDLRLSISSCYSMGSWQLRNSHTFGLIKLGLSAYISISLDYEKITGSLSVTVSTRLTIHVLWCPDFWESGKYWF